VLRSWDPPFQIGDRVFTEDDMLLIKDTIRRFGFLSRGEMMATVCENLPWKAPNGKLKIDACRLFFDSLEAAGIIELPPKIGSVPKGKPKTPKVAPVPCPSVEGALKQYLPIKVEPVEFEDQALWNATMDEYHPLGYKIPFGAHQRYWIYSGKTGRILGALLFSASAQRVTVREEWIGWTAEERARCRCRIINNSRYLILPGVQVPHLASHALGLVAKRIKEDWQKRYGFAPVMLETFVEPPRAGTCYLASNWVYIGDTVGAGRSNRKGTVSIKKMFLYPLERNWKTKLYAPLPVAVEVDEDWGDESNA
jgi:hypothetical protein